MTGSTKPSKPFLLGVAGGSGSGKTYFAQAVLRRLGSAVCEIVYQDNFYFDQSSRFDYDGGSVNFDHPDSIDFEALAEALEGLRQGNAVDIPIYDFVTHSRKPQTLQVQPKPIVIVDGILIFHSERVRMHFHDLIFFETDEDLRFQRRLDRDTMERGRTPDGVKSQFYKQVKPMHDQFVVPSMSHAHRVIRDQDGYLEVVEELCKKFETR